MKKNKLAKVRDHDHLTGKYRGAAHSCCNINYFSNRYVPVVFHNLRGYDAHLHIKEAYRLVIGDRSVILIVLKSLRLSKLVILDLLIVFHV